MKKFPKIVAVVGDKKCGKTKLIEFLIGSLIQHGLKIGSAKHIHHSNFSIDTPGTDTWRHIHAGATVTLSAAEDELALIKKGKAANSNLDDIISFIGNTDIDLLIIEGFRRLLSKRNDVLKIVIPKDGKDSKTYLKTLGHPIIVISKRMAEILKNPEGSILFDPEANKIVQVIKKNLRIKSKI